MKERKDTQLKLEGGQGYTQDDMLDAASVGCLCLVGCVLVLAIGVVIYYFRGAV